MFREARHSAAPVSAREEILAAAEFTVPSPEDEGVAFFLEKFFLTG
jgi:hydroxymethylpyrimidine pyrophosphatase-like HAD family hydrolase